MPASSNAQCAGRPGHACQQQRIMCRAPWPCLPAATHNVWGVCAAAGEPRRAPLQRVGAAAAGFVQLHSQASYA
eukprot:366031-Chlamydomonas_euryale.AAC.25